ncbi:alpha/beta fold hydrolase [Chitinophaga sp. S165]|uniref:alpha/beta fold hydrolase n=1 Tax=Chitinophaga sp. S165 TaxID=2135462 RepID=UPI000D71C6DB|nr:alpha/beta hydrolase [Chitinophaga sp. S165]PWV51539.1 pimeloyl-ACP methyl ester carboxylesterase [Chitinophaga sp. S165]
MNIQIRYHTILTSHGSIAVEESGKKTGIPLLMVHGNSFCRGVFRHQLQAPFAQNYRLITFDLPGHGESGNALDPMRTYTLPGFADTAIELLEEMGISEAVVLGWSLGGHIAIEMMSAFPGTLGLMITGTPPVSNGNIPQGFKGNQHTAVAGKEIITEAETDAFVGAIFGDSAQPFLRNAVMRADGRFRKRVFEAAREGAGVDQRLIVETSQVPLAVVNGDADPVINLDYIDTIAYANLWENHCYRLPGLGHTPFWQAPDKFNPILERFLQETGAGK